LPAAARRNTKHQNAEQWCYKNQQDIGPINNAEDRLRGSDFNPVDYKIWSIIQQRVHHIKCQATKPCTGLDRDK